MRQHLGGDGQCPCFHPVGFSKPGAGQSLIRVLAEPPLRLDKFASHASPELAAWRAAVDNSDAAKACAAKLGAAQPGDPTHRVYTYYLSREEQFARSYAQYIATKSQDAAMLKQLAAKNPGTIQWTDADFAPIMAELDKVFTARGWL